MEKRKWRKEVERGTRYRQQLTKPKIQRFAPEKNNPHGRESYTVLEPNKQGVLVERTYTRFCSCRACQRYLELLEMTSAPIITALGFVPAPKDALNPMKAVALTEDDGVPSKFMGIKALPEHVHRRRMLHQTLGRFNLK
jgi:hypothetical protein